jgi:Glycosyltransferase family 87
MHSGHSRLSVIGSAWFPGSHHEWRDLAWQGGRWLLLATAGALAIVLLAQWSDHPMRWLAWDSRAYWDAIRTTDPYHNAQVGGLGAYLYSPAFLQVMNPAGLLPWPAFLFGWTATGIGIAIALGSVVARQRPWLWLPIGMLALLDIWAGNINLLLAAAVVLGFRWPAAWSFVILTKVTPGIGLLWFAVRREWHSLAIALAATALVIGLSALLGAHAWLDWVTVLLTNSHASELSGDIAIPAFVRFPVALVLVGWGAYRNQRWVLPLACLLLLPVIWPNGLAILLGCAALAGTPGQKPASDRATA